MGFQASMGNKPLIGPPKLISQDEQKNLDKKRKRVQSHQQSKPPNNKPSQQEELKEGELSVI